MEGKGEGGSVSIPHHPTFGVMLFEGTKNALSYNLLLLLLYI